MYEMGISLLLSLVMMCGSGGNVAQAEITPWEPSAIYTEEEILKWMRKCYWRFFSQQFKRSCLPDGPKVGSVSVSPRGDLRMPSDANVRIWMDEIEKLN